MKDSLQITAKRYFDQQVFLVCKRSKTEQFYNHFKKKSFSQISLRLATLCGPPSSSSAPLRLRELESLAELALHKMGLTLVEVQNRVNLAQVFLW